MLQKWYAYPINNIKYFSGGSFGIGKMFKLLESLPDSDATEKHRKHNLEY